MRVKQIFGVLLLTGATLAYGSVTIDSSSLGFDQSIQVNGNLGYQTAGGGGEFYGSLSGTPGTNTVGFWCVDDQEAFSFGESGLANVTLLSDTALINSTQTHYGTVTNSSNTSNPGQWLNTGALPAPYGSSSLASANTADDRYTLAAYLVTQYNGFDAGINGNTAEDDAIQQAIWAITNTTLTTADDPGIYENNYRSLTATTGSANIDSVAYWVNQALQNAGNSVNTSDWAVVSWGADASGNLYEAPWNDSSGSTNQTFLVELSNPSSTTHNNGLSPEPGFYGALAVGLSGLFYAARRRKKV